MKNSKRIIAALLWLLISVVLVQACASDETPESFDRSFDTGETTKNLGGYEFSYALDRFNNRLSDGTLGYAIGSPLEDEAKQRIAEVQSEYNCTISTLIDSRADTEFIKYCVSGSYWAEAVMRPGAILRDIAIIGAMTGLSSSDSIIDYTDLEKWGNYRSMEELYYKDDLIGVVPCLWPQIGDAYNEGMFLVNENIVSRIGVTDPREYVENNTWTWAKLEEVVPTYYAEEGGQVLHYALQGPSMDAAYMFLYSNGDRLGNRNQFGEYEIGQYSATAMVAMNEANKIFYGDFAYACKLDLPDYVNGFIDGNSVLFVCNGTDLLSPTGTISMNMENYGMISAPVGPDADPGLRFCVYSHIYSSIGMTVFTKDVDSASTVIDALYAPICGIASNRDRMDYLRKNYFFDDRDATFYLDMAQNAICYYFHYYEVNDNIWKYIQGSKTPYEFIEKNKDVLTRAFNEYVVPSIEGMNAVWGDGAY